MVMVNSRDIGPRSPHSKVETVRGLTVAGSKNPFRTLTPETQAAINASSEMVLSKRSNDALKHPWLSGDNNHYQRCLKKGFRDTLTPEAIGTHEYGEPNKFLCYQDPSTMFWHVVDYEGKEPIGEFNRIETMYMAIDKYNREVSAVEDTTRIEYVAKKHKERAELDRQADDSQ